MVSVHGPGADGQTVAPPTNRVIKVLSMYGGVYKTFGENIILLLNREGTCKNAPPLFMVSHV